MAKKRKVGHGASFCGKRHWRQGSWRWAGSPRRLVLAGQAGESKLGASLIGKLEGPENILDPAKWPKKFGEAPMLADLVKQGKLPPVDQRVPEEPMVIKPVHSIGRYGGTWRRGFTGPGDGENGNRIVSTDKILFWDYTGTKIVPCVARDVKMSEDGRVIAVLLRKGHKWSDGHPFTADDFVFWYEDVYLNKNLNPTPHPDFMVNGKPGQLYKRDEHTVIFEFPDPNYLFLDMLAGSTRDGRRPGHPAALRPHHGRLHAGPLHQAVPAEVLLGTRWTGRRRRRDSTVQLPQPGREHGRRRGLVDPDSQLLLPSGPHGTASARRGSRRVGRLYPGETSGDPQRLRRPASQEGRAAGARRPGPRGVRARVPRRQDSRRLRSREQAIPLYRERRGDGV